MNDGLHYQLCPCWNTINVINRNIELIIKDRYDLLPATKMVSTELMENAIKYGEFENGSSIQFDLSREDVIQISVANQVKNEKHLRELKRNIENISKSDNLGVLYKSRLQELMDGVDFGESMIGLYRIAFEGGFSLSYNYSDGLLTVIAKRAV